MPNQKTHDLPMSQATEALAAPLESLLSIGEVTAIVGASRSTIYAWLKQSLFPPPIRIGPRRVSWRTSEIQAWIESPPLPAQDRSKACRQRQTQELIRFQRRGPMDRAQGDFDLFPTAG